MGWVLVTAPNQFPYVKTTRSKEDCYLERKYWCYNGIPGISSLVVAVCRCSSTPPPPARRRSWISAAVHRHWTFSILHCYHSSQPPLPTNSPCLFRRLSSFVNCSVLLQLPFSRLLSLSTLFYCFTELDQIGVFLQWADALFSPIWTTWVLYFVWTSIHPKLIQPEQRKRRMNWHRKCCFLS